jgi:hypothetical protein
MRSCQRLVPGSALFAIVLSLTLVPTLALAEWIDLGGDVPVSIEVLSDQPGRTVYAIEIGGFEANEVEIDGAIYHDIWLPGESRSQDVGLPELPDVRRALAIADDRAVRVSVLASEHVDLPDLPVVPSKGNLLRSVDPALVAHQFDPFYRTGDIWPAEVVTADAPHVVRDLRGVVVDANAFQYLPQTEVLRVYTRLVIEVADNGPGTVNVLERNRPFQAVDPQFDALYAGHFLNYPSGRYTTVAEDGGLLIISHDSFAASMHDFLEWKRQKGLDARLVTLAETGSSFSQIKNYIADAYATWAPAYVLLVGDIAQIPIGSDSDPEYSTLVGSDSYPELFVGRFSAENPDHVATQVQRTLTYERDLADASDFMQYGMGVASNQGPGDDNEYDDDHENVIRQKLLNYGYLGVDQIYDPSGTAAMVTAGLEAGRGIINYTGHGSSTSWGSTGFSNSHINALSNHDMLPFICSVACNNGTFTGTCFAETWLRATDLGTPTGAIATYMSYISQSWNPPMCAQDHAVDLLVQDRMRTIGGLWFNGSCQMMDEYGSSGAEEFLNWTIFGDPSLAVRTKAPQVMTVSHAGVLLIGMTEYAVETGEPGARCALYADGTLYGTAIADDTGQAVITMAAPPQEPLTLTLTVTAYNRVTVQDELPVLPPEGPYLVCDETIIAADADADAVLDLGESAELDVALENVGVAMATDVTATLTTEDPYLVIDVASATYGAIAAGAVGNCIEPFELHVTGNVPDGHLATITVLAEGAEGSWTMNVSLPIQAPQLLVDATLVDDTGDGNGSGTADAGEQFLLDVRVLNAGSSDAHELSAALSCASLDVTLLDGAGDCELVTVDGVGLVGTFLVEILPSFPEPAQLPFELVITGTGGYTADLTFELAVGGWFDDVELDRGWIVGAADDDASTGAWVRADPVGTSYNGQPVQPENDHTPVPGINCWVTGNGTPGGEAGGADIDGGKTTLLSPVFALDGAISATVSYWRWYTNDTGNNPGEDWWEVSVTSNGVDWVLLEHTQASAASWQQYSFELSEYVTLTDQVQLRFVASDEGSGSLVEAAIDDFLLDPFFGDTTPVGDRPELPDALALTGNHPNPFNPATAIRFAVPRTAEVELAIYDVAGRRVATLVDGVLAADHHEVTWQGRDDRGQSVASGVYFCRLADGEALLTRKMLLVK